MKHPFLPLLAATLLFGACCCHGNHAEPVDPRSAAIDVIMQRSSVRSYNGDTIPAPVMESLLRAYMAAPSGMNVQPWSVVVLTDKSQYDRIFAGNMNMQKFMESGAVLVLCADTTVTRAPRDNPDGPAVTTPNPMWRDDMGAATENLLLAVEAQGLGACWTACYPFADRMATVKAELGLPPAVVPYAVVPVGYPVADPQPKDKWDPTRVHHGRW